MKHCPIKDCYHYSYDAGFCPIHGEKLIDYPLCAKCGKQLIMHGDYCPKCGTKRPDNQDRGK